MKNYIKLNTYELNATVTIIETTFAMYCDELITDITDKIQAQLTLMNSEFADEDKFYNTLDKYDKVRETYTMLLYHHKLYKDGVTRRGMFQRVCMRKGVL